ncbi:MAG: hypothetical protein MUC72_01865 [Acidobacteria bacterium]|jgi:hypothetical protein|nr:hypothetical protein [Acidobacteriota bacterium]
MKIDHIFAAANFNVPAKVDWARREAIYLLKIMEADPNLMLAERFGGDMSPAALESFFRRRERSEKVCHTLRYLLAFLSHVPAGAEVREEPVNPAEQFRNFIRFQADLLLEDDVRNAVFQETNHKGNERAGTVWDFQEQVIILNRKLRNMIAHEIDSVAGSISLQCRALEELCRFWFGVRNHDIRRTRRSDIFMYLLAQLVRERCWRVT